MTDHETVALMRAIAGPIAEHVQATTRPLLERIRKRQFKLAISTSLAVPTAIPFALFAQLILVEASCTQFAAHIASDWSLAGFPVSAAVTFALLP